MSSSASRSSRRWCFFNGGNSILPDSRALSLASTSAVGFLFRISCNFSYVSLALFLSKSFCQRAVKALRWATVSSFWRSFTSFLIILVCVRNGPQFLSLSRWEERRARDEIGLQLIKRTHKRKVSFFIFIQKLVLLPSHEHTFPSRPSRFPCTLTLTVYSTFVEAMEVPGYLQESVKGRPIRTNLNANFSSQKREKKKKCRGYGEKFTC